MNNHEMLARVFSLQAEMEAVKAEIEGMKVTNEERARRNEASAYSEDAFCNQAVELRNIATALHQIGWC